MSWDMWRTRRDREDDEVRWGTRDAIVRFASWEGWGLEGICDGVCKVIFSRIRQRRQGIIRRENRWRQRTCRTPTHLEFYHHRRGLATDPQAYENEVGSGRFFPSSLSSLLRLCLLSSLLR